jgi:hypothetical protein
MGVIEVIVGVGANARGPTARDGVRRARSMRLRANRKSKINHARDTFKTKLTKAICDVGCITRAPPGLVLRANRRGGRGRRARRRAARAIDAIERELKMNDIQGYTTAG